MKHPFISGDIVLRFAPSPTGYLHVGGARTALYNWLLVQRAKLAGATNSKFILRIEDTDEVRSTSESITGILEGLSWLGLNWDLGPGQNGCGMEPDDSLDPHSSYFQSNRKPIHVNFAQQLWEQGHAFYSSTPPKANVKVDSEFRDLSLEQQRQLIADNPGIFALKLKAPLGTKIVFEDLIRGRIEVDADEIGDQVIVKSNGNPIYNFAVVCDDHDMKVTHIIRGEDHLTNTSKQILIYNALGFTPPTMAHLPLILNEQRQKLSKRRDLVSVTHFRDKGYLPEAMVNFLALIGWSPGEDREEMSVEEMIDLFDLPAVGKSGGIFDYQKLKWINGRYLRKQNIEQVCDKLIPFVKESWVKDRKYFESVTSLLLDRVKVLDEYPELAEYFFEDEFTKNEKDWSKFLTDNPDWERIKPRILSIFSNIEWETAIIETELRKLAAELELNLAKIAQPIRVACCGVKDSPPLFDVLLVLGRVKIQQRINKT